MRTVAVFLLLFYTVLFAGDDDRVDISAQQIFYPQGFTLPSYHSIGFSDGNSSIVSEMISANPATITKFNNVQFGMEYEYASEIDNAIYSDVGHSRNYQWVPVSFGSHFETKGFHFGLGFYQKYSSSLDFEPIPITSVNDPDGGDGLTVTPEMESSIFTFGGVTAYSFQNLIAQNDALSVGIQLNVDYLYSSEEVLSAEATRTGSDITWKLGLNYEVSDLFSLGYIYESGMDMSGTYEIENLYVSNDLETRYNQSSQISNDFTAKLPSRSIIGLSIYPTNQMAIAGTITQVLWDDVNELVDNNYEFSLHTIYGIRNNMALTLGIYRNEMTMKEDYPVEFDREKDYTFLNAGIKYRLRRLDFQFEIYDSHWESLSSMERTIYKFGIGYMFGADKFM
ncbi:MAG: hypothetical protein AB7W47_04250 [Calditrichaceae bacterium]